LDSPRAAARVRVISSDALERSIPTTCPPYFRELHCHEDSVVAGATARVERAESAVHMAPPSPEGVRHKRKFGQGGVMDLLQLPPRIAWRIGQLFVLFANGLD
jgi:hypothetical protein